MHVLIAQYNTDSSAFSKIMFFRFFLRHGTVIHMYVHDTLWSILSAQAASSFCFCTVLFHVHTKHAALPGQWMRVLDMAIDQLWLWSHRKRCKSQSDCKQWHGLLARVRSLCPAACLQQVAQPKLRGNIVAGSLIGATFARSFGADGVWEGTVTKVRIHAQLLQTYIKTTCPFSLEIVVSKKLATLFFFLPAPQITKTLIFTYKNPRAHDRTVCG